MEDPASPELVIPALATASTAQLTQELQSRYPASIIALHDDSGKAPVTWYYWQGGQQWAAWLCSRMLERVIR